MPDRRSSLASLARQAVIISNGLTSAAIALPECLTALPGHASDALRNLSTPPPPSSFVSFFLSLSLSLSAFPPVSPFAHALAVIPYRRPSPSWTPCFSVSLTAACSLGLSEARPLVFLLFPSRLRLLLVITTNLSRINSPSGINSSTVQAEKEKVIARVGAGNSPRYRASRIRLAVLCPLRRKRKEI